MHSCHLHHPSLLFSDRCLRLTVGPVHFAFAFAFFALEQLFAFLFLSFSLSLTHSCSLSFCRLVRLPHCCCTTPSLTLSCLYRPHPPTTAPLHGRRQSAYVASKRPLRLHPKPPPPLAVKLGLLLLLPLSSLQASVFPGCPLANSGSHSCLCRGPLSCLLPHNRFPP